jgi:hypothetical protein
VFHKKHLNVQIRNYCAQLFLVPCVLVMNFNVTYMRFSLCLFFFSISFQSFSQGVGIPSKTGGIGFGNLPKFTGIRFNVRDKNVEKINGISTTIWQPKEDTVQTGTVNGISIGLPMALGTENRNGINVGVFGTGARKDISGINLGGLGMGAGGSVTGINIGGLGMGAGGDIKGINIGGLGAGSGKDVVGFNFGGLGIGAGGSLRGITFGGLGTGASEKISGITIGGLGVGSGKDISGITIGGIGIGSGRNITGLTVAGIGVGCGGELRGIVISGIAAGSPKVKALAIAPVVGGKELKGLMIAPAYMKVGFISKKWNKEVVKEEEISGTLKGVTISSFNQIRGAQQGVAIGVVNFTNSIKGIQLGLINIVKENPKGLRVLPIFNTRFIKGS